MQVKTDDGRVVNIPDDMEPDEQLALLESYKKPNILQRFTGHADIGAAIASRTMGNILSTLDYARGIKQQPGVAEKPTVFDFLGDYLSNRPVARQVAANPETSTLGQLAAGWVEFLPQFPIYGGAGKMLLGPAAAAKIPLVSKAVQKILPVAGEGILAGTARAIPRAAIEGMAVGTVAQPGGTDIGERLARGAEEAKQFAMATAVLHPAFSLLGKAWARKNIRRGTTPAEAEAKLAKEAKTNPKAAEVLNKIQQDRGATSVAPKEEELFVPKEEQIAENKYIQGELPLVDETVGIPENVMKEFYDLGYSRDELSMKTADELIAIRDGKIVKEVPTSATTERKIEESNQPEYRGTDVERQATEAGGGYSNEQRRAEQEQEGKAAQAEAVVPTSSFTTAKGSTYQVNNDGTTIRNKAARPEHPGDEGLKPPSEKTYYVTKEDADKLSLFQTYGRGKMAIGELPDGRIGVTYLDGKDVGKFERRTVVTPQTIPSVGLLPVEIWKGGSEVHFGNEIVSISDAITKVGKAPVDYQAEADKRGIVFNGMQEQVPPKPDIPTFTDSETGSTFYVPEGSSIDESLAAVRKRFTKVDETLGQLRRRRAAEEIAKKYEEGPTVAEEPTIEAKGKKRRQQSFYQKLMEGEETTPTVKPAGYKTIVTAEEMAKLNIPPEEIAKAEAAAARIDQLIAKRKEAKIPAADREHATDAEKAEALAQAEREIAEAEAEADKPYTLVEAISKLQDIEDDGLDVLLDNVPKTREEIFLSYKLAIEQERVRRAKEADKAKREAVTKKNRRTSRKILDEIVAEEALPIEGEVGVEKKSAKELEEERVASFYKEHPEFKEGYEDVDIHGTTLDFMGFQQIYNYISKLRQEKRAMADATSKKIIAEKNGKTLTVRDDEAFIENSVKQLSLGAKEAYRQYVTTPDVAYKDNPKVGPLIFDAHKALMRSNFCARQRNDAIAAARTMLADKKSELRIKRLIEHPEDRTGTVAEDEVARIIKGETNSILAKWKESMRTEIVRNQNPDTAAAIMEVISGRPLEEVQAKYAERVVPDKLGRMRKKRWVDPAVLEDIVNEYNAVDKIGIDNYVTHVERGTLRIVSEGKLYAKAIGKEDAAVKWLGLIEKYPDKEFKMENSINTDFAQGMSKKAYNRTLYNLQKGLEDAIEDINSSVARRVAEKGLKGRFFIDPSDKWVPYTMPRREFLQGEENIFDVIYSYISSMEKKLELDPALEAIRRAVNQTEVVGQETYIAKDGTEKTRDIKRPYLTQVEQDYLKRYAAVVKGKYYLEDKIVDNIVRNTGIVNPRAYSRFMSANKELQGSLKLGYTPIKGVVNAADGVGRIWTKTGSKYIKDAIAFNNSPEGIEFQKEMEPYLGTSIIDTVAGQTTRGSLERRGLLPKQETVEAGLGRLGFGERTARRIAKTTYALAEPTGLFQLSETPMRKLSISAHYLMAKGEGMSEVAARDTAIKATWFGQVTYDVASIPPILRGPTMGMIGQFKMYMFRATEFFASLRGPELGRYIGYQLALAGPRGLNIMLRSLPFIGGFAAWDELEELMNKEYPRASRGVASFLGMDVSGPATFQFPKAMNEWLGPTISNMQTLYDSFITPIQEGKGVAGMEIGKAVGSTFPIYRYWNQMIDQVVTRDGWVKNERGQKIYHIDSMPIFAAKAVMGAQDIQMSRVQFEERHLGKTAAVRADMKQIAADDILDTIAKGAPLEQSQIDNMKKLHLTLGTLRRALIARVRDPMQRRLMATEIIRRPEILELYPTAEDLR